MISSWASLAAPTRLFILCAIGVTLLRLITLVISPVDLHYDEAQYWAWSRTLDWGYFSKPPLIAWAIAATTGVFGDGEAAVRMVAPLGHLVAGVALFGLGRRLYGPWVGVWAGLGWILLPAVALSAAVISTDALMLPIWACALYALFHFLETPGWRGAFALGALIGLGALAKYAMLYFLACLALSALWAPRLRARLVSVHGAIVLATMFCVLAPNLIWNATNGFATVGHTAANANLNGDLFNPGELLDFVVSQIGVIGPVLWGALGVLLYGAARDRHALGERDKILIAFILPPLVFIIGQALVSRAHANWAAAAYPAAVVWMAGSLSSRPWGRVATISAGAINGAVCAVFMICAAFPAFADTVGLGSSFKRSRGWEQVCAATAAQAAQAPYTAILVDHRALFFSLTYYCRPELQQQALPPLRMWLLREDAANHAAMSAPMTAALGGSVLGVNMGQGYVQLMHDDFAAAAFTGETVIDLGAGESRWIGFSLLRGFQPTPRDAAFEARINGPSLPLPPVGALPETLDSDARGRSFEPITP